MSDLDDLLACDRQELIMRWRWALGSTPPKHSSMQFLQKVLAHDLQCRIHGDVSNRIEKQLKAVVRASAKNASGPSSCAERLDCETGGDGAADCRKIARLPEDQKAPPVTTLAPVLSPGVQLVREWNGRTWQVEVLENGFACRGKTYRSLSAIARMITGTRWSGPRFFGLRPS